MQVYNAIDGQSVLDVCLQTYGNLDFLYKLIGDSGFDNVNTSPYSGQQFSYDPDLLQDQTIGEGRKSGKLATLYSPSPVDKSSSQQSLTLITKIYATDASKIIPPPPTNNQMYQKTESDSYTAGADDVSTISLPDWIGWDILQVEMELKPLKVAEWTWNKSSGTFNLVGTKLAQFESLFFLFKKMTT